MSKKQFLEKSLLFLVLVFCTFWLVNIMFQNEVPTDIGDGIVHFFISQGSWEQPSLFLHHWGKPFFILLSSPFSQFGFNGMVIFNILSFIGTSLIAFRILTKLGVSVWFQIPFPLIMLSAHDITNTIFGGLTEPLFNLVVISSLYFLLDKRFIWFAIIVSLLPFIRSEGQLPVLLAIPLLIYYRSYKSIPFLFVSFLVYAIIGIFVYGDFWWYFTKSPYNMDNAIYGKGTWNHYLLSYKNYLGNPGLYILLLGIPSGLILISKKKWKQLQIDWGFYAYGIFLGVLISHSYFWATGQNGSLGLTRIATQGMPIFLLLHLYYISQITLFNHLISKSVLGIFSLILAVSFVRSNYYPKRTTPFEKQAIEAAKYLRSIDLKGKKCYFHLPLICYAFGENSFKRNNQMVHYYFDDLDYELKNVIQSGDLIIRDSYFGPGEFNLPLKEIQKHPELVVLREFTSPEQVEDSYGETEGIIIYQYVPLKK